MQLKIMGCLGQTQQINIEDVISHINMHSQPVCRKKPIAHAIIYGKAIIAGKFCTASTGNNI